jgi:hypothetical protein
MAGKELMYKVTLHGHYLTISSGWMVILWDLVLITSTTGMVWKDIQSVPADGSRISFISEILYCSSQSTMEKHYNYKCNVYILLYSPASSFSVVQVILIKPRWLDCNFPEHADISRVTIYYKNASHKPL